MNERQCNFVREIFFVSLSTAFQGQYFSLMCSTESSLREAQTLFVMIVTDQCIQCHLCICVIINFPNSDILDQWQ